MKINIGAEIIVNYNKKHILYKNGEEIIVNYNKKHILYKNFVGIYFKKFPSINNVVRWLKKNHPGYTLAEYSNGNLFNNRNI